MKYSLLFLLLMSCGAASAVEPVPDLPFKQEYHEAYPLPDGAKSNDVRAIAVSAGDHVWAATGDGVYRRDASTWKRVPGITGPAFDLFVSSDGSVWAGAWDGLYRVDVPTALKAQGVTATVTAIAETGQGLVALGPEGSWQERGGKWSPLKNQWARHVRDAGVSPDGALWIATGVGLYRQQGEELRHYYQPEDIYSGDVRAIAFDAGGNPWIGARGGIDAYQAGSYHQHLGTREGLPNPDVRALAFAPDGTLWAGTELGVARYRDGKWSLRHSRRWLLSDDVRGIAFDSSGNAWVATAAGVSAIKHDTMTLAEKADHYLDICQRRHVRAPYLVEKCYLPDPANLDVWEPYDDDNDGTFTAMYMVGEAFRWAVTKDPAAKKHARKAFDALLFLEEVDPIEGFFARTVIPSDWTKMADANHTMTPEEYAERRVRDPRTKRVDERWRLSSDGKWLWKGDTSSDEVVGHFFGYYYYYELVADDAEKERVRAQVRRVLDYIIDGGYYLRDIDGEPTRWGVWAPESVLHDPDWRVEGVNKTFEILSMLTVAHHITGDKKYLRHRQELIDKYGYGEMARKPKSYGRSERTHIQDDLIALCTPGFLLSETDPARRAQWMEGVTWAYRTIENDHNPFFNFIYGAVGGEEFHLDDSVALLRDQPLDLRQYTVDNSKREDIGFRREPMLDPLQTDRMLPASERGVMRWDKNPWEVVSGDFGDPEGHLESSGVFWLLPYWMGRYYGFIAAPSAG